MRDEPEVHLTFDKSKIYLMIEEYKFGSITIDGKIYEYDVEVRWTGEVLKWWRGESHVVDLEDVKRAIEYYRHWRIRVSQSN
jgi:hypothetical protein